MGSSGGGRRVGRTVVLRGLLVAVVIAVAFTATVVVVRANLFGDSAAPAAQEPDPTPIVARPGITPVPSGAPAPTAAGLAAVLAKSTANPDLGRFGGTVADAITGQVLWSVGADTPLTPASTTKILTAAAAMVALPADRRVATTVVRGADDGQIVLVGGGDPTLTAQPPGAPVFYPGGGSIAALADQVRAAGVVPTSVVVDIGRYGGDTLAPGWSADDIGGGDIAPIQAATLDGARLNPLRDDSPRSASPALDAGRALAAALGVDQGAVSLGVAPAGAPPVATVFSAPLRVRLGQMLERSDNVLAEAIGREVAAASGRPQTFDGAADAVVGTLRDAGFDLGGVTLADTSGLSTADLIPARVLGAVMTAAASDAGPTPQLAAKLRPMLDYLPVAGATGTLAERYDTGDRTPAGWLRAKTGTLSTASALAGYVVNLSGRVLTFALISNDRPPEAGRPALDAVAGTLRACGCG